MNILLDLFLTFAKIGLFTFGGGYAMISLIERSCVEKKQWITHDEMMNITVIAESTPGPIAINCATFVGYKQKGLPGAIAATIGMVLPSFCIKNPFVQAILRGLKPCIIGIILATGIYMILQRVFTVFPGGTVDQTAACISVVLAAIYFGSRKIIKKGLSPVALIGISALAGVLVYGFQ